MSGKLGEVDPIHFGNWQDRLRAKSMVDDERELWKRQIIFFLGHCKRQRTVACIAMCRDYLARVEREVPINRRTAREALRWFVLEGRKAGGDQSGSPVHDERPVNGIHRQSGGVPPPSAAQDLGNEPWEKALIVAIRSRHLLWRTEQTYRV